MTGVFGGQQFGEEPSSAERHNRVTGKKWEGILDFIDAHSSRLSRTRKSLITHLICWVLLVEVES